MNHPLGTGRGSANAHAACPGRKAGVWGSIMILLEFHHSDTFSKANGVLKRQRIRCVAEPSGVPFRSSRIYLFEENVRTDPQRRALGQARGLEAEDRSRQRFTTLPHLADPQ